MGLQNVYISRITGIKKNKCLPNKEYITGHRYQRTNMAVKFYIFLSVTSHLMDFVENKYDCQTRNT